MADSLTDRVGPPVFQNLAGPCDYAPTVDAMREHVAAIRAEGATESVWLLEHAPVYTAGTSALDADLLNPADISTHRTGRGGQWTYHGPGQRVIYVMLDLRARGRDVRCFVQQLERWVIAALAEFNVTGHIRDGRVGGTTYCVSRQSAVELASQFEAVLVQGTSERDDCDALRQLPVALPAAAPSSSRAR